MDFLTEEARKNKKILVDFLDTPTNQEIIYFTRSTHMEERQVKRQEAGDKKIVDNWGFPLVVYTIVSSSSYYYV